MSRKRTTSPVIVTRPDGSIPSGQRGALPWGYTPTFGDAYCPACTVGRDWLTERCEPLGDEICALCGHSADDVTAAQLAAFAAQQREWSRIAVNPTHEDGRPLPSGMRGTVRVF